MIFQIGLILVLAFTQPTSPVVTNEVMANPKGTSGAGYPEDRNEFVELYNASSDPVDIRSWRITDFDATDSIIAWTDTTIYIRYPYITINSTIIPPFSYAVILDPEYTSTNPIGGEVQPYNFPDDLLILTIGNTTIGNELQTNDPILLYSLSGDSSSFGTPFTSLDSFPLDAGDGISWERISAWVSDTRENWVRSLDTTGSTPGRDNSILTYFDLAVLNIDNRPAVVRANMCDTILVVIKNIGYQSAYYWNLTVFDDKNRNNVLDNSERLFYTIGNLILVNAETTISFIWDSVSVGEHLIWAVIHFPEDRNLNNNKLSKTINALSVLSNLTLVKSVFSPNNDGIDDSLLIQYNLPEPNGKLTILVYNLNGKLIRKIIDKKITNKSGVIGWDGKNDDKELVPIGIYIIYLEYKTSKTTIREKTSAVLVKRL